MKRPSEIVRTTLADIPDIVGVYVLAYMGGIVYVGKAENSVADRLATHAYDALSDPLGEWLRLNMDHGNVRLDVLVPPDRGDGRGWLCRAEEACIRKFRPVLNRRLP